MLSYLQSENNITANCTEGEAKSPAIDLLMFVKQSELLDKTHYRIME